MAAAFQPNAFQHNFQVADLVAVPDVVGDSQAVGTATLEGAGFTVSVTTEYSSTVPVGDIISQSPVGGSMAIPGSVVIIVVSLGESFGAWKQRPRRR